MSASDMESRALRVVLSLTMWQSRMAGVWKLNHTLVSVLSLIYYHFTYIICLASKYAPTVPAIIILRPTLICASQCGLVAKSRVLLCSPLTYVTSTLRTRRAKLEPIDIADSRGILLVLTFTTYGYSLDPHLYHPIYTLVSFPHSSYFLF
jgi:hypothetical protein